MTTHETCIHTMRQRNADAKAGIIDDLMRRGLSRAEALSLAERLSATPADHRAARSEISDVLELRA
ncbi:hypothetical protein [Streptomyces mirabilis]|uniref:hypothetical protein n=1 Tax=Streptomyces mirabilis TaxID=68239 RepID=UPI00225B9A34|nr:hypothetical protein [Streptomyces mirabilis]MCX4422512.1 hypothetical protein [Streptomyces mirabilis]